MNTPGLPSGRRTLLLVDDEENIIASLRRLLRRAGYHILSAGSAAEGLQRLEHHRVDVILSDQRMPGMAGVEFLRRARTLYPGTVCLSLTAHAEMREITDAVAAGVVFKALGKPWDDDLLLRGIAEAFRWKELAGGCGPRC